MCLGIIRFLFLILLTGTVLAQDCRYGHKELTRIDSDRMSNDVRDFVTNDRYADDWACLMKKRHLKRDSLDHCAPTEQEVGDFLPDHRVTIEGKVSYMGMIKQPYRYDVSPEGIDVRIAFTGELGNDEKSLSETREKLKFASEIWTKNSPGGKTKFTFRLVGPDENPHFTPKLVSKAPGTKFNSLWAIDDSKYIVAHEVGHMVGLDDEYSVIRSLVWQVKNDVDTRMCNTRSLLCDYMPNAKPYPYHYYVILRRAYCLMNK